jgi:hypothetical protein
VRGEAARPVAGRHEVAPGHFVAYSE